jgi:Ca-activated chloride channel family protein
MEFAWPWIFVVLPLPWLWRRVLAPAPRQEAALRAPFFQRLAHNPGSRSPAGERRHTDWLSRLAWLLLVCAAARPQWIDTPLALPQTGRDILMALDISGSMEIPDFTVDGQPVTRLDVVRATASQFLSRRVGDRIGLILFGSQAYLQTPLTFDRQTVQAMIDDASIGLAGKETAIGDAIGIAIKRLTDTGAHHRVLILLTDGANTAGEVNPRKAAEVAAQMGLRIYTIGLGAESMRSESLSRFGSRIVNPSRDLDEGLLKQIATTTGGQYFRAKDTEELETIYDQLDALEPAQGDNELFRPVRELYRWPLALALALSVLLALRQLPWPTVKRGDTVTAARAPSPTEELGR